MKEQSDKYLALNVYGDIHEIIRERDRYKSMYKEESKKNNKQNSTIESQKRIFKTGLRSINNTMTGTGGYRPTTSGYY